MGFFPRLSWPDTTGPAEGDYLDIRDALRGYLLAQPAISSVVGQRVRPIQPTQLDDFPAVTYQINSNQSQKWKRQRGDARRGMLTIEAWCHSLAEAVTLKMAIDDALDPQLSKCLGHIGLVWIEKRDERDLSYRRVEGSDDRIWRIALDYFVKYTDT